eukprot:365077-Chlamydomonas_euryale.AAC.8
MTRLRAMYAAAAAAEAVAVGSGPQPLSDRQLGSHQAGPNHPQGKVAASTARRPLRRASTLGGLVAVRWPG